MDDDDLFRRSMDRLGVDPLERRKKGRPRPGEPPRRRPAENPPAEKPPRTRILKKTPEPDEEDSLFLSSMEELFRPPDKDSAASRGGRRRPPAVRRLKASRSRDARPEATLDLHGLRVEEALRKLESFLVTSAADRAKTVLVVTGKGLRSAGGVGVLREALEAWLRHGGKRWVRAYSEAPRSLGGRGAYVLYLR